MADKRKRCPQCGGWIHYSELGGWGHKYQRPWYALTGGKCTYKVPNPDAKFPRGPATA